MDVRFCLLAIVLMFGGPTVVLAEGSAGFSTYDEYRDQGILYLRKKQNKLAFKFLTTAFQLDGGASDFKTVYNRGVAAHELLDLNVAFDMLELAKPLVKDSKRNLRDLTEFEGMLKDLYGRVDVEAAPGETNRQGRIFLESQVRIINKKKRSLFKKIQAQFRDRELTVPTTIYLPHGRFTANNVPVTVSGDEVAKAKVYLQGRRESKAAAGSSAWWIAGAGTAAAVLSTVGAYFLFADRDPQVINRLAPTAAPRPEDQR